MSRQSRGVFEKIPGSGEWWIRYADASRKLRREKAGTKAVAIKLYTKRKQEALQGKKLPESLRGRGVTFEKLCDDALEHSEASNGEQTSYELGLKLDTIKEVFGKREAASITKQDITRWLEDEAEERGWAAATRNRYQAAFSLVYRVALDNGKVQLSPAARIKRRLEDNGRIRFLNYKEEGRLITAIRQNWPHYLPAFLISLHTGARRKEQFSLEWEDVSLSRNAVTFRHTKNGKPRTVGLNATALAALKELKPRIAHGPVFRNTEGNPLRCARDWFEPAVEAAKLKDYTWHCNRHTFASRLVMAGVDIRTVAHLMGHSTIQMTMRYAHLAPEHAQAAVGLLVKATDTTTDTEEFAELAS